MNATAGYSHTLGYAYGQCPAPFYQLPPASEVSHKGYELGRLCFPYQSEMQNEPVLCCLPCPFTYWLYPDEFEETTVKVAWISLPLVTMHVFLLLSFSILPVQYTKRHYLNVGAVLYSMVMDIGFLFPLATRVDRCYDEVTPNDMTSDVSCAFSGSMVILGGWAIILWGLARTFLLHVQVCWNQDLVTNITTLTVMIAWFAPIVGLVSALVASGVSYRMGKTCLLNARNESSLWAPLLAVSCLALFLQIVTMLYSSYIFLKSYRQDGFARNRATLPSNSTETTPSPCQQLLERVRRLCSLQWRGVMTGVSTASLVLFYCNVFWSLNAAWRAQNANPKHMLDWITCIVATNGNKTLCFSVAEKYLPSDKELYAVMCLLIGGGLCCIVFLFRFSMLRGWYHLITGKIDKHENVPFEGSGSFAHRHWHEEVPNSLGGYSVSSSTTMQELVSEEPSAVYKHGTKDGLV